MNQRQACPAPIRVLIVNTQRLFAEALAITLATDPELESLGVVADPEGAAECARQAQLDVILLGYPLLHLDESRAVTTLLQACPTACLLILTVTQSDEALRVCIEAGAVGLVSGDWSTADLITAIKRAHSGEVLFDPTELIRLISRRVGNPESCRLGPTPRLTIRQTEVLEALAAGLTVEDVAERLYLSVHTVRAHLKAAMAALGAHSQLEAVMAALRGNWITLMDNRTEIPQLPDRSKLRAL